jgi:hypothetical protein
VSVRLGQHEHEHEQDPGPVFAASPVPPAGRGPFDGPALATRPSSVAAGQQRGCGLKVLGQSGKGLVALAAVHPVR